MDTGLELAEHARRETDMERLDRNMTELLTELRIALPGVQVLFAFLLVVPFNQGWARLTIFERRLYFATLLCTALATVLLISPTVHHRVLFRQHEKAYLVATSHRLTEFGLGFLAIAMTAAVALVTHVEFGGTVTTVVVTAIVAVCFAAVWYALPLGHRRAQRRHAATLDTNAG